MLYSDELAILSMNLYYVHIRESVDSLCRDGADAQYMQYLSKSRITSPQTRKKAYLSIQASSLSAFVISKTRISGQKLRGRQLNAEVCGHESAIFLLVKTTMFKEYANKVGVI